MLILSPVMESNHLLGKDGDIDVRNQMEITTLCTKGGNDFSEFGYLCNRCLLSILAGIL